MDPKASSLDNMLLSLYPMYIIKQDGKRIEVINITSHEINLWLSH